MHKSQQSLEWYCSSKSVTIWSKFPMCGLLVHTKCIYRKQNHGHFWKHDMQERSNCVLRVGGVVRTGRRWLASDRCWGRPLDARRLFSRDAQLWPWSKCSKLEIKNWDSSVKIYLSTDIRFSYSLVIWFEGPSHIQHLGLSVQICSKLWLNAFLCSSSVHLLVEPAQWQWIWMMIILIFDCFLSLSARGQSVDLSDGLLPFHRRTNG